MSFSSEIKSYLCSAGIKNRCCRCAELYGMYYARGTVKFTTENEFVAKLIEQLVKSIFKFSLEFESSPRYLRSREAGMFYTALPTDEQSSVIEQTMAEYSAALVTGEGFVCPECKNAFMRGVFLMNGTVSDPAAGYHLELSVSDAEKRERLVGFLTSEGMSVKSTIRRGVGSVYVKESETIEDILTFIGASAFSIKIMDMKILRDIRNYENRRNNCDTANIFKSTGAAAAVIKYISVMIEDKSIDGLGAQLKETAMLRLENPELSMSELAGIHEPPITKSGLSHRLTKIIAYYEKRRKDCEGI